MPGVEEKDSLLAAKVHFGEQQATIRQNENLREKKESDADNGS